ncbi:MAG: hypothetical protein M3Q56_04880 [Bacteroidota bacterium]|nr:hypothetical protein [Bacteroidota bacterium]
MKIYSLIFFVILSSLVNKAYTQVNEVKQQMSLGVQSGLAINIPGADAKFIEKQWKKYTKDFGKIARNRKADEDFISGAIVKDINGGAPIDMYSQITEQNITVYFDMKNGFLNKAEYAKEYGLANNFMQTFGYEVQKEMVRMELDSEKDKLKKLEKNIEKLRRDNTGYHQDIAQANEKIKRAEANMVQNDKDQQTTQTELGNQTKTVEMVQQKLDKIGKPQ